MIFGKLTGCEFFSVRPPKTDNNVLNCEYNLTFLNISLTGQKWKKARFFSIHVGKVLITMTVPCNIIWTLEHKTFEKPS